jgi:hypothetical protein
MQPSNEPLSDDAFLRAMETLGDSVPRVLIDEAVRRGAAMQAKLIAIACDEERWKLDSYDWRSWLPLHAVMALGLRDTEQAGLALAQALEVSTRAQSELNDYLGGVWPALLRNKPDSVLPPFEQLLHTRADNEYCRLVSAEVLTAAAERRGDESLNNMLQTIADLAADTTESLIFRMHMGALLLSFPRPAHRAVIESLADVRVEDYGTMYRMSDVEQAFEAMKDEPEWERFDDPWEFYSEDSIAHRREARMAELEAANFVDSVPNEPYVRELPKIGRNDPCPCGSGKKYKKCCLALADDEL